ncbi:putative bifunctional diguanylate cyclase/phosphodiesterase [Mycobacterium antarcticum]|uniref:putative bifunctional diguanylate cyclase/phosphodiesterase n=1 Tax=Mycolicibacterium sp. TUM20983 TaxID=3023369 RepID=UPI0024E0C2E2|nr:bifunctional diguanylate cyclase/phosphodiesterase [Mycolicibacterium sp. TUM20983]
MGKNWWVVATATVVAVAFSAWFIAGWGGDPTLDIVTNLGCVVLGAFATVCAGLAARGATGRRRLTWGCIGVGLAGWLLGSLVWGYLELVADDPPFPSLADVGYLMFPVGVCVGLAVYPVGHAGHSRTRMLLDGLISATAMFQISWVVVLRDVYAAGGTTAFAFGLSLAYPIADVIVITMAVLVLARARAGQRRTLTVLTLGVIVMALADSLFVYLSARDLYEEQIGRVVDIGYLVGLLAIGAAALCAIGEPVTESSTVRVPPRWATYLPYAPIAIAGVVCAPTNLRQPEMAALFFSTIVLVVAVLLRQFFVVAENRRLLVVVAEQAMRDPLTGLANRALFNDRLSHAMQFHVREGRAVAVLSLDLDDFKLVNDNLGHPAGDQLLVLVAERIVGCVRTGDTVARVGGDEFAVLLEGKIEQSRRVAHRLMASFDELFLIDGHDLLLRPSIGLAVADDTEISASALLKHADVAMYSAKRSRTGGVHTFDPEMHLVPHGDTEWVGAGNTGTSTVRLLGQLRHAIDHAELSLLYQPKFALRDGAFVGAEALVRWPHPECGLLAPDQFLPLVREHGLMKSLTDLVMARALDDTVGWQADGFRVPVAVNMFAPSLCDLTLPDRTLRLLDEHGLSPDLLTIEITEDLLLDNVERTRQVLDSLRASGIRVAIDDFGSGYSALGYLCKLPIDEVKLDRQFIAPIVVDPRAAAVVRSVVNLGHQLGMTIVAEGVENEATTTMLRDYGCDVAQGFYFSHPLTADGLREMLRRPTLRAPVSARSS